MSVCMYLINFTNIRINQLCCCVDGPSTFMLIKLCVTVVSPFITYVYKPICKSSIHQTNFYCNGGTAVCMRNHFGRFSEVHLTYFWVISKSRGSRLLLLSSSCNLRSSSPLCKHSGKLPLTGASGCLCINSVNSLRQNVGGFNSSV
jgi:hypothetical protein